LFGKVPEVEEGDFFCKFCKGRLKPSAEDDIGTRVFAFGNNEGGQLGLGDEKKRIHPTLVEDLKGINISEMSIGGWNSAFLTSDGNVYSCGDGTHGKTGQPDIVHESLTNFRLIEDLTEENRYNNEGDLVKLVMGRECTF